MAIMKHIVWTVILGYFLMPTVIYAGDSAAGLIMNLDLLNHQTTRTELTNGDTRSTLTNRETKSAKPGGLQVAIFVRTWALLASIAPDTATTGLVGLAYAFIPGQYFGLAYNLNAMEYGDGTPGTQQDFYGVLGYNILPITDEQRLAVFWTLGPTYTKAGQKLDDDTITSMRGNGSQFTLTLRYQYQVVENLKFTPAIKIALTSSRLSGSDVTIKRKVQRLEYVPLALQLQI